MMGDSDIITRYRLYSILIYHLIKMFLNNAIPSGQAKMLRSRGESLFLSHII